VPTLIIAALVFVHGAIHLSYLAPHPPEATAGPPWPFALDRSWVLRRFDVPPDVMRLLGLALTAVTFATLTLAAISIVGLIPTELWPPAVAIGAGTSLALLLLFFHPWLVIGLVIDVALLAVASIVGRSGPIPA
jgi:hypothetical protein